MKIKDIIQKNDGTFVDILYMIFGLPLQFRLEFLHGIKKFLTLRIQINLQWVHIKWWRRQPNECLTQSSPKSTSESLYGLRNRFMKIKDIKIKMMGKLRILRLLSVSDSFGCVAIVSIFFTEWKKSTSDEEDDNLNDRIITTSKSLRRLYWWSKRSINDICR